MQIIDAEGRLFGKINLIDFMAILGVIMLAAIIFRFTGVKVKPETTGLRTAVVKVELYGKRPWYVKAISVGDTATEKAGSRDIVIAEIIEKETIPNRLVKTRENKKDIALKVKLLCEFEKDSLKYKGQKVKIGYGIKIETRKVYIEGVITDVQSFPSGLQK